MEDDIMLAIVQHRIITFVYNDKVRTCEPHVFGIANRKNQVLCYQTHGGSQSGGVPEWRRFDIGGMQDLKVTKDKFPGVRPYPSGAHSIWDRVVLSVS